MFDKIYIEYLSICLNGFPNFPTFICHRLFGIKSGYDAMNIGIFLFD